MARLQNLVGANVAVYSFGNQLPHPLTITAKYMINVAHFRDPLGNPSFRNKKAAINGLSVVVQDWMKPDPRIPGLIDTILMILRTECPNVKSGSSFISFALYDHHGKWAAPALAEMVADSISRVGWNVAVVHHDVLK